MSSELKSDVPVLSSNEIELKAQEVIEYFEPSILFRPCPTPIELFALQCKRQFGVEYSAEIDLGRRLKSKVLGRFSPRPRAIFVDVSLRGTDRFPFVLAHEFGHLVLHRRIDPIESGYTGSDIRDIETDLITGKKLLQSPRDWIEWQANRFASAILMPRMTFIAALIEFQTSVDIHRNIGRIVLEDLKYSINDFRMSVSRLSATFGVNRTNVEFRLRDLEILEDLRGKDTRHVSQMLSEEIVD